MKWLCKHVIFLSTGLSVIYDTW